MIEINLTANVEIIENILTKRSWINCSKYYGSDLRQVWERGDKYGNLWVTMINVTKSYFYMFYIERKNNPEIKETFICHKLKFPKEILKTIKKVRLIG